MKKEVPRFTGTDMENFEVRIEKIIFGLLEQKKYSALRDILVTLNPADIAALLNDLKEEKISLLFRLLPKDTAAEVFVEMDADLQEALITGFSDAELKEVIEELYVDDAVDLIEDMPANVVKRILKNTDPNTRKTINEILKYPEDSAGSIMTTEYVDLRQEMTVNEAIKRIRRTGVDKETVNTCYVTDDNRHLLGSISLRALLLSEEEEIVSEIMNSNPVSVFTHDDKEEVAKSFEKYDLIAIPVTDGESRLVGIVTVDDAIDVIYEEATEDIEKMAAITPGDRPYLKTPVFEMYKSRIPWLLLLMLSSTFTGLIITSFENALAAQVALTAFIPMLMGSGGNSGSQSSVTVIRGLSIGEIEFSDTFAVILKELRVAILCGVTLAAATFIKIIIIDGQPIEISFVVSLSMLVTVFIAKVVGCMLPIAAKKAGFDPAVMASPFITTIVDALSLIVYFNVAGYFLW